MSSSLSSNEVLTGNISWMAESTTPAFKRGHVPVAYVPAFNPSAEDEKLFDFSVNGDGAYIMADISTCKNEDDARKEIEKVKEKIQSNYPNGFYFTDLSGKI